ncbi:MAG TPA: anaerobic C4-dicarboxylate transporter, partial [Candidatus Aphodousia faecipullorum]|nr:anaerobic C4-dicarboxylate transporter [Candidatus Aphodousia faecipullorum]
VAILGMFPQLRPKGLSMTLAIQMFMLLAGSLMIIFCAVKASEVAKNSVFRSGAVAVVAVYGVAWMADTMIAAHLDNLKTGLIEYVNQYPWAYAIVLLLVSKFVNSQGAALAIVVPAALGVGVSPGIIVAFSAACYGYYILPTYPSDLAAIQFDRSGTTHIGRFVINHSFIIPGLLGVFVASVVGWLLAAMYGFV